MSASAKRLVGIDLGGTAIKSGVVSGDGRVLGREAIAAGIEHGAGEVLDRIAAAARELGVERELGVGSPGLFDRARGVVLEAPNLKCLEGVSIRDELARRLGLDAAAVHLENDANAAAWGEHWLGASKHERDSLFVTLGTGVGGGLILAGELFRGSGGMAGEIGHVVVDPKGLKCGCGAVGCLETLASATAARRRALERGLPAKAPGDLELLAQLARASNGPERALLLDVGRDLGHGLAVAVSLLDVRAFVIGGGFGAAIDVLEPGIRAGIRARSYGSRLADVRIVPAALGADAGWIGAARLALG